MSNGLNNAGYLDGLTNWHAVGGAVLAVDETTLGAAGRAVLVATGGTGNTAIQSDPTPVSEGQAVEAFARWSGAGAGLVVDFLDAGGGVVESAPVPLVTPALGSPKRGLPPTFNWSYGRPVAPVGTTQMRLVVWTPTPARLALLKPYLAWAPLEARPTRWDPGGHVNPDLQLSTWPSSLPPFQADGLAQPIANAKSFTPDSGIPIREDLYAGLHQTFQGQMRLDDDGWDVLDQFYRTERDSFYVVRPDTDELCVAEWLDSGAPTVSSISGPWTIAKIGLHLQVA